MENVKLFQREVENKPYWSIHDWIKFTNALYIDITQDNRLLVIKNRLSYENRVPNYREVVTIINLIKEIYGNSTINIFFDTFYKNNSSFKIEKLSGLLDIVIKNGSADELELESNELAFDSSVEVLTAEAPDYYGTDDRRFNAPMEPGMVFEPDTLETVMTTARPWNSTYLAYGGLLKYHSLYGLYQATIDIGEAQAADNHLTPGIVKGSTNYHIFQENTHKGNLDRFTVSHDFSTSTKQTIKTGAFSRVGVRILGADNFLLLHQGGTFNITKTSFDGTNYGTATDILTSPTKRIYPFQPYGPEVDNNGWHLIPFAHTEADPGAAFPAKGLMKTQDWVTFYNIDETQSFDISGGAGTLAAIKNPVNKWIYIGDSDDVSTTINLNGAITCRDASGRFYDLTIFPGSNQVTITYFRNGAWQQNVSSLNLSIAGFPETGLADSNATCWCIFLRDEILYALIRVTDGGFHKFHMYKTINEGVSWTDMGDVTPGVNTNVYRAVVPLNIHEVPNNVNFPIGTSKFVYVGGPAALGDVYLLKAAFGTRQTIIPYSYTTKYNSISEFPSLHVAFGSDDVTISSGTTISLLNDKVGARDAVAIGSPQLTNGEIVCNGTNSAFQLTNFTTEFNAHTVCTICFVGRSSGYIFTVSKSTDDQMFELVRLLSPVSGQSKFSYSYRQVLANTLNVHGTGDDISTVPNIYVFQINGRALRMYINGREQNKILLNAGTGLSNYGQWGNLITPNRVGIGVLQRTTNIFTPLIFKELTYAPVIYNATERKMAENYLSDKYSIPIVRGNGKY